MTFCRFAAITACIAIASGVSSLALAADTSGKRSRHVEQLRGQ